MDDNWVVAPVPEPVAIRLARELYGLEAEARALPGEYDANFHLSTGEGPGFVLKVMHPDREQGLITDFDVRPVVFAFNRVNAYTLF